MHHPLVYKKNKLLNNGVLKKNTQKQNNNMQSLQSIHNHFFLPHFDVSWPHSKTD